LSFVCSLKKAFIFFSDSYMDGQTEGQAKLRLVFIIPVCSKDSSFLYVLNELPSECSNPKYEQSWAKKLNTLHDGGWLCQRRLNGTKYLGKI
jgi:hypothetical protein